VLKEMNAAQDPDHARGVRDFDRALFGHIGFTTSNAVRSFFTAITLSRIVMAPVQGPTRRYYEHINRFSASFAFAADVAMLSLGGYLKKKENLSARLGDVLSALYLASMVLKHYENQGRPPADLPLVEYACRLLLYQAQEQLHSFIRNFPVRWLAAVMRLLIFPRGLTYSAPGDRLNPQIAELVMNPGEARERLCQYVYRTLEPTNHLGLVQEAMELAIAAEPVEKKIRVEGIKTGRVTSLDLPGQIREALSAGIITEAEAAQLREYDRKVMAIIHVDDFDSRELQAGATDEREMDTGSVQVA
jgi:acyl-CoA dehydrogenase